jgi:hypothetical protein
MSGFDFHLRCRACGLASDSSYPDRYSTTFKPDSLDLPAVNRATGTFEHAIILITVQRMSHEEMIALAAKHSTPDVTVCVKVRRRGVVLEPPVGCPRCGQDTIEAPFGSPPRQDPIAAGVAPIIAESRELADDTGATWRLDDRGVFVRTSRHPDEHSVIYSWGVHRRDGVAPECAEIAQVVAELIAALTARGSTCTEPTEVGAFTHFEERT